jgi:sugar lactone lactonase YvrE
MPDQSNALVIEITQQMKSFSSSRGAIILAGLVASAVTVAMAPARGVEQHASSSTGTPQYAVEAFIPGSAMHGVHGLAFDSKGELYGASLTGYSIYRIDRETGAVTTEVGPHLGSSDDLAFGPDGMLAWTAGAYSAIHARMPDGEIRTLADELPGVNSINFSPDGRLFATRIFGGDHLYEIDTEGEKPPRLIAKQLGGLNGFEITADNKLYGPLFFKKKVIVVDLETGVVSDVADGFDVPAAVNIDKNNNLYVVDYASGEVTRIDLSDGKRSVLVTLEPPLDNLAIDDRGFVYASNPAFNRVTEINPETGETREIVTGALSTPGGLAIHDGDDGETLFIADFWGNRTADIQGGTITMFPPPTGVTASSSIAVADNYYAVASIWPFGVVYLIDRKTGELVKRVPVGAPYDMVFLDNESLLVADYKNNLVLQIGAGKSRDKKPLIENLDGPVGLAVDQKLGLVYVSEYNSGQVTEFFLGSGERKVNITGLEKPEGLALDTTGNLMIAETGRNQIWSVNGSKGEKIIAENIPMGLVGGDDMPPPYIPTGITVDAQNRIYVSSDLENAIYRLTPAP